MGSGSSGAPASPTPAVFPAASGFALGRRMGSATVALPMRFLISDSIDADDVRLSAGQCRNQLRHTGSRYERSCEGRLSTDTRLPVRRMRFQCDQVPGLTSGSAPRIGGPHLTIADDKGWNAAAVVPHNIVIAWRQVGPGGIADNAIGLIGLIVAAKGSVVVEGLSCLKRGKLAIRDQPDITVAHITGFRQIDIDSAYCKGLIHIVARSQ